MSVVAVVRGSHDARCVGVAGMERVGEVVRAVHAALRLPRPLADYWMGVGDGEEHAVRLDVREDETLAAVGIMGCEERITVAVKFPVAALEELAGSGITAKGAAKAVLIDALAAAAGDGDASSFDAAWRKVRLVQAAGLTPLPPFLFKAASDGNVRGALMLLDLGVDVNAANEQQQSPLFLAASSGHAAMAAALLRRGAAVDAVDLDALPPLLWAAAGDHASVVEVLLTHGAAVNAQDRDGRCALHYCAQYRCTAAAAALVSGGADMEHRDKAGRAALHAAVKAKAVAVARVLLEAGCDVDPEDDDEQTPLLCAAAAGYADVVEVLVAHSARAEAADRNGLTPVRAAESWGRVELAGRLRAYAKQQASPSGVSSASS